MAGSQGFKTATTVVRQVGEIHFSGNVIPHSWFEHLRTSSGKPYMNAIVLLSEIVYWYRPEEVLDERTGRVIGLRRKFDSDKWQKSHNELGSKFGLTKKQVRDALAFLREKAVITTEHRNIQKPDGTMLFNVQYIEVVPDVLRAITHSFREGKQGRDVQVTGYDVQVTGYDVQAPPSHPASHTNTDIPPENPINIQTHASPTADAFGEASIFMSHEEEMQKDRSVSSRQEDNQQNDRSMPLRMNRNKGPNTRLQDKPEANINKALTEYERLTQAYDRALKFVYGEDARIRNGGFAGKFVKRLIEEFNAKPEEVFMCFVYLATDPFNFDNGRQLTIKHVADNLDAWRAAGRRMLNPKASEAVKTKVRRYLQQNTPARMGTSRPAQASQPEVDENGLDMAARIRIMAERSGSAVSIDDVL